MILDKIDLLGKYHEYTPCAIVEQKLYTYLSAGKSTFMTLLVVFMPSAQMNHITIKSRNLHNN